MFCGRAGDCPGRKLCEEGPCAGVDEAGRGPLAGPVVAAAVVLPRGFPLEVIGDSKALRPEVRRRLYALVTKGALSWSIARVGPERIDEVNILRASLEAMERAVLGLKVRPSGVIVDGPHTIPGLTLPQVALVDGDARCPLVGAASILAKVARDRLMGLYHRLYPMYGFDRHKGYPTREHREALRTYGPCPLHRRSFKGVDG